MSQLLTHTIDVFVPLLTAAIGAAVALNIRKRADEHADHRVRYERHARILDELAAALQQFISRCGPPDDTRPGTQPPGHEERARVVHLCMYVNETIREAVGQVIEAEYAATAHAEDGSYRIGNRIELDRAYRDAIATIHAEIEKGLLDPAPKKKRNLLWRR